MNTPTHAQALGEVLESLARYTDGLNAFAPTREKVCEWERKLKDHGQHFAGLESALAKSNQSRAEYAGEIGVLQVELLEMKARAEAAEAQRAELEDKYASVVARYDAAADKLLAMQDRAHAAEARVREAEGLLREMLGSGVWFPTALEFDSPEGEDMKDRIAAFLAASGGQS